MSNPAKHLVASRYRRRVLRLLSVSFLLTVTGLPNAVGLEANSRFFSVRDYYAPDANGNYQLYSVAGFAQPANATSSAQLLVLPAVRFSHSSVKFFDKNGSSFDPVKDPSRDVAAVRIAPAGHKVLPTASQIPAIAAALEGVSIESYKVPSWKVNNQPAMMPTPLDHIQQGNIIRAVYADYDAGLTEQTKLAEKYKDYKPQEVGLNGATISLIIDGVAVATVKLPGITVTLPSLTLLDPTVYQKTRILEGTYELLVTYRFLDTKTSSISAKYEATKAINVFVDETRDAVTKGKSSGFQVFNLGARREKIRSALKQSIATKDNVAAVEATSIVMHDATDDMIELFESHFFPSIGKDEVVKRHEAAAATPRDGQTGNAALAKAHADYADALRNNNELKEVDAVAAAAAAGLGDWASFIANGVRSVNSSDKRADTFRRIETSETEINKRTEWNQVKSVSIAREVSVPVHPQIEVARRPRHGIARVTADTPFATLQWMTINAQGHRTITRTITETGLVITCLEHDGPAAKAGLAPGMVIQSIGTTKVTTEPEFLALMDSYSPGDQVPIKVQQMDPKPSGTTIEKTYNVKIKAGPPRE